MENNKYSFYFFYKLYKFLLFQGHFNNMLREKKQFQSVSKEIYLLTFLIYPIFSIYYFFNENKKK